MWPATSFVGALLTPHPCRGVWGAGIVAPSARSARASPTHCSHLIRGGACGVRALLPPPLAALAPPPSEWGRLECVFQFSTRLLPLPFPWEGAGGRATMPGPRPAPPTTRGTDVALGQVTNRESQTIPPPAVGGFHLCPQPVGEHRGLVGGLLAVAHRGRHHLDEGGCRRVLEERHRAPLLGGGHLLGRDHDPVERRDPSGRWSRVHHVPDTTKVPSMTHTAASATLASIG